MSEPSANSPLRQRALDHLADQYLKLSRVALEREQVSFRIEPEYSRLYIESRAYTDDNEVGKYTGSHSVSYTKADLAKVLPHPLEVVASYPMRYRELCEYLYARYKLIIEDNEFSLIPVAGTAGPLSADSILEAPPVEDGDILYLRALPSSVLWRAGTSLAVRIVKTGNAQSIGSAVTQVLPDELSSLLDFQI